jgi:hypothetical protein
MFRGPGCRPLFDANEDAKMKRMLLAVAMTGLAIGAARADWGGFGAPAGGGYPIQPIQNEFNDPNTLIGLGAAQPGRAPDRYGLLPGLRRAFRLDKNSGTCSSCGGKSGGLFHKGNGGCSNCGNGHGGYGYGPAPQYPPMMQGTLVFPNHTYVRSPRDFFMYEPGR